MGNMRWLACVVCAAGVVGLCGYRRTCVTVTRSPESPAASAPARLDPVFETAPELEVTTLIPLLPCGPYPTSPEPPLADGVIGFDPQIVTAKYTETTTAQESPCCEWLGRVLSKSGCWIAWLRSRVAAEPEVRCEPIEEGEF